MLHVCKFIGWFCYARHMHAHLALPDIRLGRRAAVLKLGFQGLHQDYLPCIKAVLAVHAGRHSWRGLTDRMDNSFLAATGELPLSDGAWDALLPRWDGYVTLMLPREYAHSAAGTREAEAHAAEARAFTAVSDCLKCAACRPSCSPCLACQLLPGQCLV